MHTLKTEKVLGRNIEIISNEKIGWNFFSIIAFYFKILTAKKQLLFIINSLNLFKNKLVWFIHALVCGQLDLDHVISNGSSSLRKDLSTSYDLKHTDTKIKKIFSRWINATLSKWFPLCQETKLVPPYPTALLLL